MNPRHHEPFFRHTLKPRSNFGNGYTQPRHATPDPHMTDADLDAVVAAMEKRLRKNLLRSLTIGALR